MTIIAKFVMSFKFMLLMQLSQRLISDSELTSSLRLMGCDLAPTVESRNPPRGSTKVFMLWHIDNTIGNVQIQ